ncbi:hypothetical protein PYCCODRAFT_1306233 [Trametes coccinea BRFM310]|uniref:Uncharacterized protein n=1 Tax=Trametes coccinea (strain BRFM310) TaxID=1353009 RepID=A0A1Y2I7Q0_TRAC3|nr:hypothetical protein PYCCODRAFT_1306233 [Trametes coccinea BRFM310]
MGGRLPAGCPEGLPAQPSERATDDGQAGAEPLHVRALGPTQQVPTGGGGGANSARTLGSPVESAGGSRTGPGKREL